MSGEPFTITPFGKEKKGRKLFLWRRRGGGRRGVFFSNCLVFGGTRRGKRKEKGGGGIAVSSLAKRGRGGGGDVLTTTYCSFCARREGEKKVYASTYVGRGKRKGRGAAAARELSPVDDGSRPTEKKKGRFRFFSKGRGKKEKKAMAL